MLAVQLPCTPKLNAEDIAETVTQTHNSSSAMYSDSCQGHPCLCCSCCSITLHAHDHHLTFTTPTDRSVSGRTMCWTEALWKTLPADPQG